MQNPLDIPQTPDRKERMYAFVRDLEVVKQIITALEPSITIGIEDSISKIKRVEEESKRTAFPEIWMQLAWAEEERNKEIYVVYINIETPGTKDPIQLGKIYMLVEKFLRQIEIFVEKYNSAYLLNDKTEIYTDITDYIQKSTWDSEELLELGLISKDDEQFGESWYTAFLICVFR